MIKKYLLPLLKSTKFLLVVCTVGFGVIVLFAFKPEGFVELAKVLWPKPVSSPSPTSTQLDRGTAAQNTGNTINNSIITGGVDQSISVESDPKTKLPNKK
jgi:hypothetical protein